jgi:hypothetical protein
MRRAAPAVDYRFLDIISGHLGQGREGEGEKKRDLQPADLRFQYRVLEHSWQVGEGGLGGGKEGAGGRGKREGEA